MRVLRDKLKLNYKNRETKGNVLTTYRGKPSFDSGLEVINDDNDDDRDK